MPKPTELQASFVAHLKDLADREDRGALAALRRGLGKPPGTAPEMFRHVIPWTSHLTSAEEDRFFLVASLFALHPVTCTKGNMGEAFRRIRIAAGGGDVADSLEKRFVALLNAHREDLPNHLRHAVALAQSHSIPVNWAQLIRDLDYWDHPDRLVQRDWARQYWGRTRAEEPDVDTDSSEEPN